MFAVASVLVTVVTAMLATASPASAIPAVVSAARTVSGFPRYFADQDGTRTEPCIDPADPFCVLVTNPPVFDPAAGPIVFPTNFPDEFFYYIADSDVITTPGCGAVSPPGKALVRVALEGTFANGDPVPGEQMVFGRVRVTVSSGLCPNTPYTFTHPWGSITLTTEPDGSLRRNQATTDIGCAPLANVACDFTQALPSTVMTRFIKWDPAIAPAAPAGYLGDPNVLHQITGSPTGTNFFRISGAGTPVQQTNLFSVSGKIAGPLNSAPETLDGGNQPINIASGPRTLTLTNVSPAALTVGAVSVSPAGSAWSITGNTCGAVARDASCTVTLVFAPTVVGPANATLVVNHNSFRTPTTIPLVGNGTAAVAPNVTMAPASLDFRRTLNGTSAGPFGFVIHNAGPGTYVISNAAIADSPAGTVGDAAAFSPIAGNDCPVAGLVAGTSCTILVRFSPTQQRPYAALLNVTGNVGATAVALSGPLAGRGGIAVSSTGLDGLGPDGLAIGSFPTWYQDDRGVRLGQCLNAADPNCLVLADATFNPALPLAFPTNFPGEAFYYITDSDQLTTPGCGAGSPPGKAQFRAATEATFVNGNPVAGEQMVFDRVRVFATSGLCPGQTYTFVHPYGEFTFVADDLGGLKRSPGTIDIGCTPAPGTPCNFNQATLSPVSDGYLRYDTTAPAAPAGYLGDAATLHSVSGAPYIEPGQSTAANYVKLLDSNRNVLAQTNLFTISGKIDPTQTATRYQTVAPKAVAFAAQDVATTSAAKTITVESVGTTPMTVTGVTVTGANATDFTVATNTCGIQAVGSTCTVTVTFRPTAVGARVATLNIASNAVNAGSVLLTGAASGPALSVAPTALTFGDQLAGTTSTVQSITVTNAGNAPLTVSGVTVGGADAADFTATSGCAAAVAPGTTCTIGVTFRPGAPGARAATITIVSNGGTATVTLSGSGFAGPPVLSVAPASLTFPTNFIGITSATQTLTVTNSGATDLTVAGVTVGGTNAAEFTATNTCAGAVVPAGTCAITVTFRPTAAGNRTASLVVTSNGGNVTVPLAGTGVTPPALLTATPVSIAFANTNVGALSVTVITTIRNTGAFASTIPALTVTGPDASLFNRTATTCTAALAPNGTCTVSFRFRPDSVGPKTATLTVAVAGNSVIVPLSGSGVGRTIGVDTTAVSFGNQTARTTGTRTVIVTNTGTAGLLVGTPNIAGTNAADFGVTDNCPSVAIAPGVTCTMTVTFTPSATGARQAILNVLSNGLNGSPLVVNLSGTGVTTIADPSFEQQVLPAATAVLNPVGTGWTFATATLAANGSTFFAGLPVAPAGNQAAVLQNANSSIKQTVTLTAASVMTLQAIQGRQGSLPPAQVLGIYVDGTLVGTVRPATTFGTFTVPLVAAPGPHVVEIRGTTAPVAGRGPATALVDNVTLA